MDTINSNVNNKSLNYNAGVGKKVFGDVSKLSAGAGEVLDGLKVTMDSDFSNSEIMDLSNIQNETKKVDENVVLRGLKTYLYAHVKFSEGVLDVGESVRDFVKMNGTIGMGKLLQLMNYIDRDVYNEMIKETKADVSDNDVYDMFYKQIYDTGFYDNVYAKNFVSTLAEEGGKFFEIVGLSLAGSYLAGAGITGAEAAYASETGIALPANQLSNQFLLRYFGSSNGAYLTRILLSGINGNGEELQNAYQNGANTNEGMKAAYLKGLWDSLTWALGEGAYRLSPFGKLALGQREFIHMDYNVKNFITQRLINFGLDISETGAQTLIDSTYNVEKLSTIFKNIGGGTSVGVKAIYSVVEMALLG